MTSPHHTIVTLSSTNAKGDPLTAEERALVANCRAWVVKPLYIVGAQQELVAGLLAIVDRLTKAE